MDLVIENYETISEISDTDSSITITSGNVNYLDEGYNLNNSNKINNDRYYVNDFDDSDMNDFDGYNENVLNQWNDDDELNEINNRSNMNDGNKWTMKMIMMNEMDNGNDHDDENEANNGNNNDDENEVNNFISLN